ncbi:MAG: ATP-binding cassette domain-containing protein [Myxococcota bacterium]
MTEARALSEEEQTKAPRPQNETPMVETRGLRKQYGPTLAVKDVSFKVPRGEIVGFLGPNGAGKSTTMKMITGYLKPTAGSAFIGGVNVGEDPIAAQHKLGYLPESAPLYDDMMVIDFLNFVADLRNVPASGRADKMRQIAERCGLSKVLGKDISQLSKGYRQRVGLAQAMVHDPDLLILDEPTSGLDPNQIVEIRELIKDLGQEKTVILSTHILPEVQATCDRIIIINEGTLVADDTPDRLNESDSGSVVRVVVKTKDGGAERDAIKDVLGNLPGVRGLDVVDGEGKGSFGFNLRAGSDQDPRIAVFEAAVQHDFILLDMHRESVSLEDTFRRLTIGEVK